MEEISSAGPSLSPVSIRPMHAGDIDHVLAIAAQLPTAPHWPRQAYLDALAPSAHPQRLSLVAESGTPTSGKTLLGFLLLSLIPPEAELESIAVAREAQQQGIGRLLLATAIPAARSAGAHTLLLEIRASNHPAAALYRRIGFEEIGRRPNYYRDPAEDAILMQLNLL